jgi:hypothetical protein
LLFYVVGRGYRPSSSFLVAQQLLAHTAHQAAFAPFRYRCIAPGCWLLTSDGLPRGGVASCEIGLAAGCWLLAAGCMLHAPTSAPPAPAPGMRHASMPIYIIPQHKGAHNKPASPVPADLQTGLLAVRCPAADPALVRIYLLAAASCV